MTKTLGTTPLLLIAITFSGSFSPDALAARVIGVLDQWRLWSFDTDTISAACIAGESPCRESDVPSESFSGQSNPARIPVEGRIKLIDGVIVELVLVQNHQVSLPISDGRHGRLTLSGLSWTLTNGSFHQAPGAFAECSTMAPVCRVIAAAIQDSRIDSPLDFDGIPDDFPVQFGALLLNQRPGFRSELGVDGAISIDAASNQPQIHPTSTIFNSAAIVHFRLNFAEERP